MWKALLLAGSGLLQWEHATEYIDGTPYTDPQSTRISWSCETPPVYINDVEVPYPTTQYQVTGLPDTGTCHFVTQSVNVDGVASAYSAEVSKFMGDVAQLSDPIENLYITWEESGGAVSVDFEHSSEEQWTGGSASRTHTMGYTAAADEIILVMVASHSGDRDVTSVTDQNTDAFTKLQNYLGLSGETAGSVWYKVADGDETQILFSGDSARHGIVTATYSGAESTILDSAEDTTNVGGTVTSQGTGTASFSSSTGRAVYFMCADVPSKWDGNFAIDAGDVREAMQPNSYVGCAVADEAFSSATSASGTFSTTDSGESAYGVVVALKEAVVSAANPKGPLGHPLHGALAGPIGP